MDLNLLKAFVHVAQSQSFSQAATSLHLTQPAVSKRVALLEQWAKTPLFDRMGRHVVLTPAGKSLLPYATQMIQTLAEAQTALSQVDHQVSGTLNLATSHHIGLRRLPPYLREFCERFPEVELNLYFLSSENAYQGVLKEDFELAIATLPSDAHSPLQTQALWRDPMVIGVHREHPWIKQKDVSIENLEEYPAILPERGTYTRELFEQAVKTHELKLKVQLSPNYLETIKMMVAVGLGWSILPRLMTDQDVIAIDIKGIKLQRTLGVIQHPRKTLSSAARALIDILKD